MQRVLQRGGGSGGHFSLSSLARARAWRDGERSRNPAAVAAAAAAAARGGGVL